MSAADGEALGGASKQKTRHDALSIQRCKSLNCASGRFCHSANAIFEHIAQELTGAGDKKAGQTSL